MPDDTDVTMPIEQQWLIHGAMGNIFAKISDLRIVIARSSAPELEGYLRKLEIEVQFLKGYLPPRPDFSSE